MSEYMIPRPIRPETVDDLDNKDTLFDPDCQLEAETDDLVDQGVANYHDARGITGLEHPGWKIHNPDSVSVSFQERFQDELDLLNTISGMHMRAGFVKKEGRVGDAEKRYEDDLSQVVEGAERNISIGEQIIRSIYHLDELTQVGFKERDMLDDIVQMKYAYRKEYSGPDNKSKRTKRRHFLEKRIKQLKSTDNIG